MVNDKIKIILRLEFQIEKFETAKFYAKNKTYLKFLIYKKLFLSNLSFNFMLKNIFLKIIYLHMTLI
jgi:hypothetical protein